MISMYVASSEIRTQSRRANHYSAQTSAIVGNKISGIEIFSWPIRSTISHFQYIDCIVLVHLLNPCGFNQQWNGITWTGLGHQNIFEISEEYS